MLIVAALFLEAASSLSHAPPGEGRIQFVFANDNRGDAKIAGVSSSPTPWSARTFHDIVRQCGGKKLSVWRSGSRITVTGEGNAQNLEVAQCVQSSTSVRFWAGVKETGFGSAGFDELPFQTLWNL